MRFRTYPTTRNYYGYSADRLTVRTIQTPKPGVNFAKNAAILTEVVIFFDPIRDSNRSTATQSSWGEIVSLPPPVSTLTKE